MLPVHLQELMTASVDSELSPAERRLVDKLLRQSDEAREFHGRLLADSRRLRALPPVAPGDDLAASIMNMIDDRGIRPTPLPTPRSKRSWNVERLLPWLSMATAAGVLIVVSLFSYLYFAASERYLANRNKEPNQAADPQTPAAKDTPKHEQRTPHDSSVAKQPGAKQSSVAVPEKLPQPQTDSDAVAQDMPPPEPASESLDVMPRVVGLERIITTPPLPDTEPFKRITDLQLSLLLPLRDLDQPYPKMQLRNELKKDGAIRIDLFCKDGVRAAEMVQTALKARGQQVLVDAQAVDRLNKKKAKSEFIFFSESLTGDEIALFLEQLGTDDRKAEIKKAGEGQFDKFLLAPQVTADTNELARLLGLPSSKINLPRSKPVGTLDPRKPLESVTAGQLAANLPKSASRGNEKMTLLLSYGTANHLPQNSKEIKAFLEKRGERKAGVVPMMLVLRIN